MENTHFGKTKICITGIPMGYIWSILEHIVQILTNWRNLCNTVHLRFAHTPTSRLYVVSYLVKIYWPIALSLFSA